MQKKGKVKLSLKECFLSSIKDKVKKITKIIIKFKEDNKSNNNGSQHQLQRDIKYSYPFNLSQYLNENWARH
jgi:hypothetical protein